MATKQRPKKPTGTSKSAAATREAEYRHPEAETPLRPDVGTQAQFRKKKPPAMYRYDSSLAPALDWDSENPAREQAEAAIREILDLDTAVIDGAATADDAKKAARMALAKAKAAAERVKRLGKPVLNWTGKAERLSFDVPTLPVFVHERLSTMAVIETLKSRLMLARDLLHPSGSVFVQISDQNVHHVRELLDDLFGAENAVSIITFKKTGFASDETISTTHDFILWYARTREHMKFRAVFGDRALTSDELLFYDQIELPDATRRPLSREEKLSGSHIHEIGRPFARNPMVSPGYQDSLAFDIEFEGRIFRPPPNRHWATTNAGVERLRHANRLATKGNTLRYVRYFDDFPLQPLGTVWNDTGVGGFVGDQRLYVVQTDTRVIERCLFMSTDPGDLVLDPTCGSGTTAYVAEQWGRRWITIDTSRVPLALTRQRLLTATFTYYELKDEQRGPAGGFVYKRKQNRKGEEVGGIVPHITLKSIANYEPPQEEVLVDRPETLHNIVRVSGPFAVEATIPSPVDLGGLGAASEDASPQSYASYLERMLEVLRKSPVLQLGAGRTVTLKNIRPPAKSLALSAEAMFEANGNGKKPASMQAVIDAAHEENTGGFRYSQRPAAIVFGPENGAISEKLVYEAAREAHAKNFAHLYMIGFAIQANARALIESCEAAAGIPATYVQATPDLMMGELLKTTRASQIFSVCGMPDVRLQKLKPGKPGAPPRYQAELLGFDVFDPATMELDHKKGDNVPAWMLDTDYNGLVFHGSQVFFPRTSAWESLKKALKATHDETVWDHLSGTVSAPFEGGEHGQIAVKVIDDRGNELLVVKNLTDVASA
jgi:adenine-specific DNA-methyltransferase